jgi:hypothetical protein
LHEYKSITVENEANNKMRLFLNFVLSPFSVYDLLGFGKDDIYTLASNV